jgi:hypothetical protein
MNIKSALFALSALAFSISASAAPVTISTGTAAPWLVNGNPVVLETPIATPYWINNFGDGLWVGTTSNDGNLASGAAPGTYTFTLNLGAYIGSAGSFSIQYAADNTINWSISSGSLLGTASCTGNPSTTDCFGSAAGAPRSMSGLFGTSSILTATVVNGATSINPMGLLVVGMAEAAAVPLPSSLAMLALGGAILGAARFRRQKA